MKAEGRRLILVHLLLLVLLYEIMFVPNQRPGDGYGTRRCRRG